VIRLNLRFNAIQHLFGRNVDHFSVSLRAAGIFLERFFAELLDLFDLLMREMLLQIVFLLVREVKDRLESFFQVLFGLLLHSFSILFSCLNEHSAHNSSSLHCGEHMGHEDWRSEGTGGEAPALIVLTALEHIICMVDDQLVGHGLDNVEHDQESVPADVSAHLQVELQLQSLRDQVLSAFCVGLAIFIVFDDVPFFEVAFELEEQTHQVDEQEQEIDSDHQVWVYD